MKQSLFYIQLIIVLFLSTSCFSPEKKNITQSKSIFINLKEVKPKRFSTFFSLEELIAIKSSENIPIKQFKRIVTHENKYWVLSSSRIFHLDSTGTILNNISRVGNGPGEYQTVDDIRWNESLNSIEVLDKNNGKLLRFNSKGEFLNEWRNPYLYLATSFIPRGDNYFIYGGIFFNGDGDRAVLVSGKSGEKLNGYSRIGNERNYLSVLNNDTFYDKGGDIEFFYSDSDTLFTIRENGLGKKYIFDFGEFHIPKEFFNQSFDNIMDFRNKAGAKDYASIFSLQPTDKHIFIFIIQGSKFFTAILDRDSNQIQITRGWSTKFGSDYSNLSSFTSYTPIGSDNQYLYFSIDPYLIKSEIDKLKDNPSLQEFLKTNPQIDRIYQNFNEYENPYLLKVRINNF